MPLDAHAVEGALIQDPLRFLRGNVFSLGVEASQEYPISPLSAFDVAATDPVHRTATGGESGDAWVYEARPASGGAIAAYYLPWRRNAGYSVILEADGDVRLMFNALMSGCSFGFLRGPGGIIRASHYNMTRLGTATVPDDARLADGLAFCTTNGNVVHAPDYRPGVHQIELCSVIGVFHRDGQWRFYVQNWTIQSGQYRISSADELP